MYPSYPADISAYPPVDFQALEVLQSSPQKYLIAFLDEESKLHLFRSKNAQEEPELVWVTSLAEAFEIFETYVLGEREKRIKYKCFLIAEATYARFRYAICGREISEAPLLAPSFIMRVARAFIDFDRKSPVGMMTPVYYVAMSVLHKAQNDSPEEYVKAGMGIHEVKERCIPCDSCGAFILGPHSNPNTKNMLQKMLAEKTYQEMRDLKACFCPVCSLRITMSLTRVRYVGAELLGVQSELTELGTTLLTINSQVAAGTIDNTKLGTLIHRTINKYKKPSQGESAPTSTMLSVNDEGELKSTSFDAVTPPTPPPNPPPAGPAASSGNPPINPWQN